MSIDCRYYTNGEKTAYTCLHTDSGIVESWEKFEDIPKSIRHYFRRFDKPRTIGPDLARFLGLTSVFYPEWPNFCALDTDSYRVCVAESCAFCDSDTGWKTCQFRKKKEDTENG